MARRKIHLADGIARVVYIETEATKGATIGTNLYRPDGKVATAADLAAYIGVSGSSGGSSATQHSQLQGLSGNDHPQYALVATYNALVASLADVAFSGDYYDLIGAPTIPSSIDDLADVNVYGAADGDALVFDSGTNTWIPGAVASGGGGAVTGIYKIATESRASTTTLTDDTDLIATLQANKKYKIDYTIWIETSATPDFKCQWHFTGTATSAKSVAHFPNGATASVSAGAVSATLGAYIAYGLDRVHTYNVSATQTICHTGTLTIEVGASGGTLSFQWAQNNSSGTAVSVARDSCMTVTEMA